MNATPRTAVIRAVGLRDGLQSIATIVSTARKCEWIRDAVAAGQREIEVGSFVPPKLLPQMADTADVLVYAKTLPGLLASTLIPNLRSAQRALDGNAGDRQHADAVGLNAADPSFPRKAKPYVCPILRRTGGSARLHTITK